MKKLGMLVLGVIVAVATVGSIYATTPTTTAVTPAPTTTVATTPPANTNCNVSIESKKETLKQYVKDGKITQEKSDAILKQLENCDGTGNAKIGQANGVKFGGGKGQCLGNKNGTCTNCTTEK